MKKLSFILFLCCTPIFLQEYQVQSTRSLGMAGAHQGQLDVWNVYQQPAYLAFQQTASLAINYSNLFLLQEFSTTAIAFAAPFLKIHAAGLGYSFYGYGKYQHHQVVGAYSLRLTPQWSVGIQPIYQYFRFSQGEFGSMQRFNLSASSKIFILPQLAISLQLHDFYQTNFTTLHQIPLIFEMAVAYHFNPKLHWTIAADKGLQSLFSARTGLEYSPIELLFLRLGASYQPILFALGVGIKWKQSIYLDVATAYHLNLGFVPSISFRMDILAMHQKK
jgi:hypothetical protein